MGKYIRIGKKVFGDSENGRSPHKNEGKGGWYRIVSSGTGPYRMPPAGISRSREETEGILRRYEESMGDLAGTIMAAHSVQVYGPYVSREVAARGDISETPDETEASYARRKARQEWQKEFWAREHDIKW